MHSLYGTEKVVMGCQCTISIKLGTNTVQWAFRMLRNIIFLFYYTLSDTYIDGN